MNEDALIYSYELFKNDGYSGSIDQYKQLIRSDKNALDYSYNLFKNDGYSGSVDDFSGLISPAVEEVKKKDTVSPLEDGGSEPTEFDQEDSIVMPDDAKPVEEPEKRGGKSYLSSLATSFGLGLASANEAIASIPESVINILAIPQNYIAEKTGLPISVTAEGIKKSWGITNPLLDYVQEEKKILSGEVSRFMAERYEDPSIVGNFQKGNYQDGFELLGSAITQSVPISLGLMAGGAYVAPLKLATVATLGFTEAQREELGEMDPTMSEAEKTLKAAGMAAAESVFSSISTGTIGKVYRDIAKREGAEAAKGILKDGLVKTYKKALEKTGVVAGFVGEGIEEAATQITQNVIAGRPAFEGAADAFVTGAGSGVVFTAPISAINAKRYIGDKVESINTKSKIGEILGDKANDIDMLYNVPVASEITVQQLEVANLPKSREILVSRLEKAVSDNRITEDDAKQSLFVFDKTQQVSNAVKDLDVSAEDKAKIATLLRQRDELKTKIQNKDDVLVVQEKRQIEQINNQIQEILSGPKQETPTYKVDGKDVTVDVIDELIKTKSREELLAMDIQIENDTEGRVERFQEVIGTKPVEQDAIQVPVQEVETLRAQEQEVLGTTDEKLLKNPTPNTILDNIDSYSKEQLLTILRQNDPNGDYQVDSINEAKELVVELLNSPEFSILDKQSRLKWLDIEPTKEGKVVKVDFKKEFQRKEAEKVKDISGIDIQDGVLFRDSEGNEYRIQKVNDNGDIDIVSLVDNEFNNLNGENTINIESPVLLNIFYGPVKEQTKSESQPQTVETLRSQEQAELTEALTDAEQYMVDGKIDGEKITDPAEKKIFDDIYNKYDKLITPLIEVESTPEMAPSVKTPADFALELEVKYGIELDLLGSLESGTLSLSRIVIPKDQRGKGVGAKVMEEIIQYADGNNKKLVLTPSKDFGGTSVKRLTDFYKRFGFVENKGKNKDFTIKDTMYRSPDGIIQEKSTPKEPRPVSKKKNREEIISRPAFTPIAIARQWLLSGGKLKSKQSQRDKDGGVGIGKGVREETGMSGVEMRQLVGVVDNKRGLSPEVAAERIYENLNPELQDIIDIQDIRNSLIDVLLSEDRKTWLENQDRETSEVEMSGYDEYIYNQLTDKERADYDQYKQDENYNEYRQNNAKKLAREYDAYIKSKVYQDYIESTYERDRESRPDAQDQNDGRGKKQGSDGKKDSVQKDKQVAEVEGKLDELLKLDPKEKGAGQKALDYLDGLIKDYDDIQSDGLGVNIALPAIKTMLKGIRALVQAGVSLNDAIKRIAKENNFSVKDVVSGINAVSQILPIQKEFDALMTKADALINTQKSKDIDQKKIVSNLDTMIRNSEVYKNANDAQRKIMEREARVKADVGPRKAASIGRVMGVLKDITNVTRQEKLQIISRIRELGRDVAKDLTAEIRSLNKTGKISLTQATNIISRLGKVNMLNEKSVVNFIDYMTKVFADANYAVQMTETRKLQRQAKSRKHTSMTNLVNQFTSINPELIPLDRIQDYIEALDFLNNRTPFYGNTNNILGEINSYKTVEEFDAVKTRDALDKKYESIELNEVKSVEEYIALIKDINSFKRKAFQLLQEDVITQEEYDELINRVGKDQAAVEKKYEKEITQIKKEYIADIKKQRPKVSSEFSNVENDLIRKYLELSDTDLESLSPEDLFILNDLLENISNGEIDYYRFSDVVSRAFSNDGIAPLTNQVEASEFNMGSERGRQELSEQESAFWEGLLGMGRAKVGALQKFIISPFNRAIGSFESFIRNGYNNFLNIKDKYKIKNEQMNKIGMLTTYLQEYMAQFDPNNKGVKDIGKRDWFKEILNDKSMRDKYSSGKPSILKMIGRGPSEIDVIQKIWDGLPKDKDGNVDPKAVYDSYIANDGKFFTKNEKDFFDDVMTYKTSDITPKQKAANELSGQSFKEVPFHMLRVRLDAGRNQIQPSATSENGVVRIKAGTGKERTSEKVGPVMTNFEKLFISSVEQTGRDYFLSIALKDINNTLSGVRKNISKDKMPLLDTISYALSDALKYEFDRTQSNLIFRNLLSARAAITLLNPIRTAFELGATVISYPVRAKTLSGYKSLFGDQGDMKKLLEFTDSPMLLRDNISKAIDINDGSIEPQSKFTKATNYLSSLPERTMMVTSWMPTFKSEFNNLTGVDFDIKKFDNSVAYREKYGKSIRESSAVADAQTEKIIGPTTKAGQRREVRIAPKFLANLVGTEGTVSKNTAAGQILGFFSNYPFREVTEFVNGFREASEVLKDEGALSSLSQLQKPLGVALNVAAYGFLSSAAYALNLMLLGDDDDDEKRGEGILKDLMTTEGFLSELASNAISLVGSKYAAGGKAMLQLAATIAIESTDDEEQKAKIKKLLKDSVFVNPLPVEQAAKFGGRDKILASLSMYIPQFVIAADRFADAAGSLKELGAIYDKVEKNGIKSLTDDEGTQVLALNTLFNATQILLNFTGRSLPAYNNLKTYMNGLKEEAGVADVSRGKKKPGKTDREKSLDVVEKNKKLKDLRELKEKTRNVDELKAIRNKIIEMTGSDEAKEAIDAQKKALTERKKKLLYDSSKKQRFNNESDMKRLNPSLWRKRFGPNSDWSKDNKAKKVVENKLGKIKTKRVDREFREKSRN